MTTKTPPTTGTASKNKMASKNKTAPTNEVERRLREALVAQCRAMNALGLNHGTAGNVSVRFGKKMLISPSAVPYASLRAEMAASMSLEDVGPLDGEGDSVPWEGPCKPSTEWRFHRDILRARGEIGAVVHTHSPYCTALSSQRRSIPAIHYMIAAFGGSDVRCSSYAPFGTAALSETALEALEGRTACLLANHGMIALGADLAEAMQRAVELEALAQIYHLSLALEGATLLSEEDIAEVLGRFSDYRKPSGGESDSRSPPKR